MSESVTRPAVPTIPAWRVYLALASVPGAYLVLTACAVFSLGVAAGLVYLMLDLLEGGPHMPIRLLIAMGLIALGGIYGFFAVAVGIVKSLRPEPAAEAALPLDPKEEPDLWQFIRDLCAELGCREPDHVLLSVGPSFHVCQGTVNTLNGKVEGRILTLGCPLLGSLTVSELRAVMAHEFAHFTGKDTLYSGLVLPVYVGIGSCLRQMQRVTRKQGGSAGWMALPMLLPSSALSAYLDAFHNMNAHLSRLRETRADTLAAQYAGSPALASALKKLVREGGLFHAAYRRQIVDALLRHRRFTNYYAAFREFAAARAKDLDRIEKEALCAPAEAGDSHPPLKQRLAGFPDCPAGSVDPRPSRCLLASAQQSEEDLTQLCTSLISASLQLAPSAVHMPSPDPGPASAESPHLVPFEVEPSIVCAGCGAILPPGVAWCPKCNAE